MLRLLNTCLLALAMLAAVIPAAVADHMNGTYSGTGEAVGATLVLTQQGTNVAGEISGSDTGTLTGQSDGSNTVNGFLDTAGVRYQFVGTWSQQGFDIRLFDEQGNAESFMFVAGGSDPGPNTGTETQYWVYDNDQQAGPLTRQQVLDRLASGESGRQTQVWTAELNQWVMIETIAELAGALASEQQVPEQSATYYLYADGTQTGPFTRDQVVSGIQQGTVPRRSLLWQPGQDEWVRIDTIAEFADLYPPALPQPVQYFVIENGARVGPLSEEEMIARIAGTTTTGDDLAWKKGLEAWAPVSSFAEFEEALAALDAPPVPPDLPEEDMTPPAEDGPPPLPGDEDMPVDPPPADDTPMDEPPITVEPPLADDAAPAGEEDPLTPLVRDVLASEMGHGTEEERAEALSCLMGVFEVLSPEHRQMLVDSQMKPNKEQVDSLEQAYPDLQDNMNACVGFEPTPARSQIRLPDGRSFAVVGGSSHGVTSVEGGSEFDVDGITIAFVNGALTVDGEARDVPEFTYILEAHIADGEVTLLIDP